MRWTVPVDVRLVGSARMKDKPKYRACWSCSRKLQGNHHATIKTHGGEVVVHIFCGERMEQTVEDGYEVFTSRNYLRKAAA